MDERATNTSEHTVKRNLVDKARYNDYRVFERLRIEDVADLFVDRCMENFERDNEEHIRKLIKIENGSIRTGRRCKSEIHEPWVSRIEYPMNFALVLTNHPNIVHVASHYELHTRLPGYV